MTLHPEDIKDATQQLAKGATVGMIDTALQKKGLGSGPRAEVLEIAKQIINRRARIKNLLIGTFGLVVVAGGGYGYYLCVVNGLNAVRLPGFVMMIGLLLAMFGIYNATQNRV